MFLLHNYFFIFIFLLVFFIFSKLNSELFNLIGILLIMSFTNFSFLIYIIYNYILIYWIYPRKDLEPGFKELKEKNNKLFSKYLFF